MAGNAQSPGVIKPGVPAESKAALIYGQMTEPSRSASARGADRPDRG